VSSGRGARIVYSLSAPNRVMEGAWAPPRALRRSSGGHGAVEADLDQRPPGEVDPVVQPVAEGEDVEDHGGETQGDGRAEST
jgi:hypothetical protein